MPSVKCTLDSGVKTTGTKKQFWLHGSGSRAPDILSSTPLSDSKHFYENVVPEKIAKPDVVIVQTNPATDVGGNRPYENVAFFAKPADAVECDSLEADDNNVTVVEVKGSFDDEFDGVGLHRSKARASLNDKRLKIVIDNFDKILDEYGGNDDRPKLQKTKSCSIIESKCILKKSTSDTTSNVSKSKDNLTSAAKEPNLEQSIEMMKTKSMIDLNIFVGAAKTKNKMDESGRIASAKKIFDVAAAAASSSNCNVVERTKNAPRIKVDNMDEILKQKRMVESKVEYQKRQLEKAVSSPATSTTTLKNNRPTTQCRANSAASSRARDAAKSSSEKTSRLGRSNMIRAKSTFEVNACGTDGLSSYRPNGARTPSKIPVKANPLNKRLSPSTPAGLDQIDRKPASVHVRAASHGLEPSRDPVSRVGRHGDLRRARSIANDLNDGSTLDKCITTGNRILKKVEALTEHVDVRSALQRRTTYTKSTGKQRDEPVVVPTKNVTSFALIKRQTSAAVVGNDEASAPRVRDATPNEIGGEVATRTHVQRANETTVFGLKHAYIVRKRHEEVERKELADRTQTLNEGRVLIENTQFVRCAEMDVENDDVENSYATLVLESDLNDTGDARLNIVEVRNDGTLRRNLNEKNVPKEKRKDMTFELDEIGRYSSEENLSDDSGNISNENELDVDDDVKYGRSVGRKASSGSDEFLLECDNKRWNATDAVAVKATAAVRQPHDKKFRTELEIFFRPGTLSHLEAQRDLLLTDRVIHLQAHCRGYLSRKSLQQRKLQETAVRCIQRNVRAFLSVRDWPWWRLLVRVTPLLDVHRTEQELRAKTEELETLRAKVEKLEQERTVLKHDSDKLEAKLSEMTADLAEEHSTATLATERLDAETSERLRLERELSEVQTKNKSLQQTSERLEMELLYARSDLNGLASDEDEDGEMMVDGGAYKQKYERTLRELEFTKRRLQQQHEDDLEQLVGLKKQLEKKLTDAYEEVEEQRQVVGQWKRKVQKHVSEMNDLRLLLEEQNSRNNLLEKKQRKFDSETQLLHDELRQEKQARERVSREKEVILAEKYTIESNLADVRLELELKDERLRSLQQEIDDLTFGGKEDEVATLRKQKQDCERRLHEQEEELDDLAGQVQILEQAKVRLEMSLEQQKKEAKRESQQREDELEEVRGNAQKKVKALEAQLENEHEERTLLLREKHSLERRLATIAEEGRTEKEGDEAQLQRLKRDLKRTKALLRDAQTMLERAKADNPGKAVIRQLRNQLDDLECARATAVKSKQSLETEVSELQSQLDDAHRQKSEAEDRANAAIRERMDLRTQIEENEEELAEVLKKYRSAVQQLSMDQMALQEQMSLVSELESERNGLKEQLAEMTSKLESRETMDDSSTNVQTKRMELRVKELESKLEFEQTTRARLEVQITRLKETVDKLQTDIAHSRVREQTAQDTIRKVQRNLRELKDEHTALVARDSESTQKRKELEKKFESAEAETAAAKSDLRLALQRIEDLQAAIQGELEDTTSDHSDSDRDSYSSDESIETFLANHKLSPVKIADRSSSQSDSGPSFFLL